MHDAAEDELTLRDAESRDLDAVAAIERESFSDPWLRQSFETLIGVPAVVFLVLEVEHAVVGYVVVWTAVDEAELANVAVAKRERGRRFGAALLDAALARAAARGARMMFLEVREGNARARALYASRGFDAVGRRRSYYRRPTEDAIVLRATVSARPGDAATAHAKERDA